MTNKIFSKTVKKMNLWAVIVAVLLAAAVVVGALFGFNQDARVKDKKVLTVSMNSFFYNQNKDEVVENCEKELRTLGAEYAVAYTIDGEMNGDVCEIVFVLQKDAELKQAQEKIATYFKTQTGEGAAWAGADVDVSASEEITGAAYAKNFELCTIIAGVVLSALAFAYVMIRYRKWTAGAFVGGCVLLSMLLTTALVVLTRIPVTQLVASSIAMSGLMTAVLSVLFLGKISAKAEEFEGDNEGLLLSAIPVKECVSLVGGVSVAMLLVGIVGRTAAAWFALSAIVAMLVSGALALVVAPSVYLPLKTWADNRPAKNGYVGAKKSAKKVEEKKEAEATQEAQETEAE